MHNPPRSDYNKIANNTVRNTWPAVRLCVSLCSHITETQMQSHCEHRSTEERHSAVPLPVKLERMQDSGDFLPQVPQVDAVIS